MIGKGIDYVAVIILAAMFAGGGYFALAKGLNSAFDAAKTSSYDPASRRELRNVSRGLELYYRKHFAELIPELPKDEQGRPILPMQEMLTRWENGTFDEMAAKLEAKIEEQLASSEDADSSREARR